MALWHVVLISFHPKTNEDVRDTVYDQYQSLAEDCGGQDAGIIYWQVDRNIDLRKNVHLVEIAIFENDDALQRFRNHPKHQSLTNLLSQIADWQVGDINCSSSVYVI